MSSGNLAKIEEGFIGWNKWAGDFMLQRIGIGTQYFDVIVPAEELKRWRLRQDICTWIVLEKWDFVEKRWKS